MDAARRTGPVPSGETTRAITRAVFDELAERGLGGLSMDAVARRAAVGKAAIYRRWPSKRAMVLALVADVGTRAELFPDTGSLPGDLEAWFDLAAGHLGDPRVSRIVPDLLAEAGRDPAFAEELFGAVGAARREHAKALVARASDRGELPAGVDPELAADLVAAPLYWRLAVTRRPWGARDRELLVRTTVAALTAAVPAPPAG